MVKTHYFEFEFKHRGKTIPATCFVYYHEKNGGDALFYKYPMYRVAANYRNKVDPDVFVFYEVDKNTKRFYWHPLNAMAKDVNKSTADVLNLKEDIAKSIADQLELFDYRKTDYQTIEEPAWAVKSK